MIIKKIRLKNFGPYYGMNEFELESEPEDSKNIILVVGKNGAGKTTILQSIKIALYGSMVLGFKTNTSTYSNFIKNKLNYDAIHEGAKDFSINIVTEITEEGRENEYEIKRSWQYLNDQLIETLKINKNSNQLTNKQKIDFKEYFNRIVPVSLLDLIFFDAESIGEFFNIEKLEDNIKKSIDTVFNLDLFKILSDDLNKYIRQDNVFNSLSQEQKFYETKKAEYNKKLEELNVTNNKLDAKDTEISLTKRETKILDDEYRANDGLLAAERDKLIREISVLEQKKTIARDEIKQFIADLLPFFIASGLLSKLDSQIQKELEIISISAMETLLNEDKFWQRFNDEVSIEKDLSLKNNIIRKAIVSSLKKTKSVDFNIIHNMSPKDISQIHYIKQMIEGIKKKDYMEKFKQIDMYNSKLRELNYKLELNAESSQLKDLIDEITRKKERVFKLENEVENLQGEIERLNEEVLIKSEELQKAEESVNQAKKDENIYDICRKANNIIDGYLEAQYDEKLELIQNNISEMFKYLIRKEDLISKVDIDSKTFNISIHDNLGREIPKDNLSAGETEILMLSMIGAILRVSGRKLPLIFDTLLGRLDKEHRLTISEKYLPNISDQVIILAVDSEFNDDSYSKIEEYICQEYHISERQDQPGVDIVNVKMNEVIHNAI